MGTVGQRDPIFRIAFTMTLTMTTKMRRRIYSVDDSEDVDGDDDAVDDEENQEGLFFLERSMRFIRAVLDPTII